MLVDTRPNISLSSVASGMGRFSCSRMAQTSALILTYVASLKRSSFYNMVRNDVDTYIFIDHFVHQFVGVTAFGVNDVTHHVFFGLILNGLVSQH